MRVKSKLKRPKRYSGDIAISTLRWDKNIKQAQEEIMQVTGKKISSHTRNMKQKTNCEIDVVELEI